MALTRQNFRISVSGYCIFGGSLSTDKEWEESMPAAARAAKREEQGKPNLTVVGSEPANEG